MTTQQLYGYLPRDYGATATSSMTTGPLSAEREFYTWREAVLQAIEVAGVFTTASKPTVKWRHDRWVLAYRYRPFAMNGVS